MNEKEIIKILKTIVYSKGSLYRPAYNKHGREFNETFKFNNVTMKDYIPKGCNKEEKNVFKAHWKMLIDKGLHRKTGNTLDECLQKRDIPTEIKELSFNAIPEKYYNKKLVFGEYELFIQYKESVDDYYKDDLKKAKKEYAKAKKAGDIIKWHHSVSHVGLYYHMKEHWNIILRYNGVYLNLGEFKKDDAVGLTYGFEEYFKNYERFTSKEFKLTKEKNCIMETYTKTMKYVDVYESMFDLFKLLAETEIITTNEQLPFQKWWGFDRNDMDSPAALSYRNVDFEYFVKKQTKDGIYSPTKAIVDKIYYVDIYNHYGKRKNLDRNLLKKLNIHTVVMKNTVHFNIKKFFNLAGVKIKAPKKVIQTYDLTKYSIDEKMIVTINKEAEKEKRKAELEVYNDTFSLVFHGKTILENKSSFQIKNYLENKTNSDVEREMKESFRPIFKAFADVDYLNIVSFGTYYASELAGEKHLNYEVENEHINKKTLKQINELYADCWYSPDENYLRIVCGWVERGAAMLVIKRKGNGLQITTKDFELNM